jgi:hypothetical protein
MGGGSNRLRWALVALLALPMAACAHGEGRAEGPKGAKQGMFAGRNGNKANAGPCPLMGVLYDASRKVEFQGPADRFANVGYTAEMRGVRGLCRYVRADPIVMSIDIDMAFGRGPKATADTHTYRYWVAVARRDVTPLAKQFFDVTVKFPAGEDRVAGAEHIDKIVIPRADENTSGVNFEILVGFDLTPEELAFNRAGKRFRVDAGAGR